MDAEGSIVNSPNEPDLSAIETAFSKSHPVPSDIDIRFFSHKTRKSTALIGNEDEENFIKARRNWLDFDFKELIYVSSIRVYAAGYEDYHEMEMSYEPDFGDKQTRLSKFAVDHFLFQINDFVRGFGLRPADPMFKTAQIQKILVSGIEKQYVTGIARYVENIEREKTKIEDSLSAYFTRAERAHKEAEASRETIEDLSTTIDDRQNEIKDLTSRLNDLAHSYQKTQEEIQIASTVQSEQNKRSEAIQQAIDQLVDQRKDLTSQISNYESQLRELKTNINLFPTEIAGYVKQGTNNIRLYTGLALIPLAIMVYVTYRLFSNSERLLDLVQNLGTLSIYEFLVSRLPYVAVSATILGICFTTVKVLVSEIIAINRRRQELFKVSIIATDVSYAAQDGMELTDEERYELRTQTKMELLKEHMKQNLGEDYVYSPGKTFLENLGRLSKTKTAAATDE